MICSCGSVGFSTGRDDPSDLARDIVNRDEQAYVELAKNVPIGRAGSPEEMRQSCCGFAAGASYVVATPRGRRDDGRS
jgi:hypothetical protein